jgi:hypothetical protein
MVAVETPRVFATLFRVNLLIMPVVFHYLLNQLSYMISPLMATAFRRI